MKKKFIVLLLSLVLCSSAIFAEASVFMKQFSSAFLVNLGSNTYCSHGSDPQWYSGNAVNPSSPSNDYHDNQMICTLGIQDTTKDVTFKFSLESGHWLYLLDETDMRFSRPFGVDLIIRGNGKSGHESVTVDGSKIVHLGITSVSNDKDTMEVSFSIPAATMAAYGSVWLDVCLVMDPVLGTDGNVTVGGSTYTVTPSEDNYKARIKVTVENEDIAGGSSTNYVDLLGYYTTDGTHPGSTRAILTVTPTAAASSLDIENLKKNSIEQVVASYTFTTETVSNNKNGKFYFFLSSSQNESIENDGFSLKYTRNGKVPSVLNKYNSVAYEAKIVSSEYAGKATSFDGKVGQNVTSATNLSTYHAVDVDHVSTSTGHGDLVRWHDSGNVVVKVTGSTDDLVAGLYTSTIYFHVITDF